MVGSAKGLLIFIILPSLVIELLGSLPYACGYLGFLLFLFYLFFCLKVTVNKVATEVKD